MSKKELGGPRNYAPRTSTGGFHSTRLILYRLFSAYRPLLTAQPPVDDTPQRSGARGGPKKVEDPTTWPQDWGAADIEKFLDGKLSQGQRSTPFDEGSGEPKRTGVLDKAQEILSAAERAVASAQRAVESAQLNVDKETLIVNCLEATLGKDDNLSADDYGVLLKGIHPLIAKYIMFASTTNPFSMDEAAVKLEKVKQDLQNAKQDLQNAKQDLQNAKLELKKANVYGAEGSVDSVLQQSMCFFMICLAGGNACDVEHYARYIDELVKTITVTGTQYSTSNVLLSSSGVGKTFVTMALTAALRKLDISYFPIALYCGFNSRCGLTQQEKNRLSHGDYKSLRNVVLRRLLLQLNYLAAPDVVVNTTTMWDEATGLQRMPVPSLPNRWADCDLHFSDDASLVELIEPLLITISEKVEQPIVLFPTVDEGQLLDVYCPRIDINHPQGARWALRLLRDIQTAMKGEHKVLGIMTGIDPEVTVDPTEGQIAVYNRPLHSPSGFKEIVEKLLTPTRSPTATQLARISATFYPIVRDIELLSRNRSTFPCIFTTKGGTERVVLLIIASALECSVTLKWTSDVPAVIDVVNNTFKPILGIRHVAAVAEQLGAMPCKVDLTDYSLISNCNRFEDASWFCLSVLLALQNYKLGFSHPNIRMAMLPMAQDVREWLTVNTPVSVYPRVLQPEDAKLVHFPSSAHCNSHAKALGLVEGEYKPLHKAFDISMLTAVGTPIGRTVFMSCGGSAPVDLIIVTLINPGAGGAKPSLQIRLCDAKLVTSATSSVSLGCMPARFELVRKYLEHHLSRDYQVEFTKFAIVTTDNVANVPDGIVVISPNTCKFSPLTDWWLAWAPSWPGYSDLAK